MNYKSIALALGCMATAIIADAEITITVENAPGKLLKVEQTPLTATDDVPAPFEITLDANGTATFAQAQQPITINISEETDPIATRIFSVDGSEKIAIKADGKGNFTATGTPLMEGVTRINVLIAPYMKKFEALAELYNTDPETALAQIDSLSADINASLRDYIVARPDSPEAPYALLMLDGQDFLDAYPLLSPSLQASVLMPSVEQKKQSEEKSVAQEKRIKQLESGSIEAPAFILPDLDGKQVSLSDFKGKWVVIDFWGSWCRWCVKGFPELKELKQKYGDELVILGVDCRDTPERWREAVKKYGLTWVNLYNDCTAENNPLLAAYAVQGFPTKVIVAPDGKIRKIVVGADPAFPHILAGLIGK